MSPGPSLSFVFWFSILRVALFSGRPFRCGKGLDAAVLNLPIISNPVKKSKNIFPRDSQPGFYCVSLALTEWTSQHDHVLDQS